MTPSLEWEVSAAADSGIYNKFSQFLNFPPKAFGDLQQFFKFLNWIDVSF